LDPAPASGLVEKKWSLYTLVVKQDQSFEIFVNNKSVSKGSLLENFKPAVNPPTEIDDKEDVKPEDVNMTYIVDRRGNDD
jgi:Calreticulin family